MDRKKIINTSMLIGATAFAPEYMNRGKNTEKKSGLSPMDEIPDFCADEHWGSITPIGFRSGGFVADLAAGTFPIRRVTLVDLPGEGLGERLIVSILNK